MVVNWGFAGLIAVALFFTYILGLKCGFEDGVHSTMAHLERLIAVMQIRVAKEVMDDEKGDKSKV